MARFGLAALTLGLLVASAAPAAQGQAGPRQFDILCGESRGDGPRVFTRYSLDLQRRQWCKRDGAWPRAGCDPKPLLEEVPGRRVRFGTASDEFQLDWEKGLLDFRQGTQLRFAACTAGHFTPFGSGRTHPESYGEAATPFEGAATLRWAKRPGWYSLSRGPTALMAIYAPGGIPPLHASEPGAATTRRFRLLAAFASDQAGTDPAATRFAYVVAEMTARCGDQKVRHESEAAYAADGRIVGETKAEPGESFTTPANPLILRAVTDVCAASVEFGDYFATPEAALAAVRPRR